MTGIGFPHIASSISLTAVAGLVWQIYRAKAAEHRWRGQMETRMAQCEKSHEDSDDGRRKLHEKLDGIQAELREFKSEFHEFRGFVKGVREERKT